ncbi:MAG: hypothetical protein V9F00_01940 [Nocardioides sp.]
MTGTGERTGRLVAVAAAVLASLAGCSLPDTGPASEPITARAVAAVALRHLPDDTTSIRAADLGMAAARGAVGADLRYPDRDGAGGDRHISVTVTPRAGETKAPDPCAQTNGCVRLKDGSAPGDVYLNWQLEQPAEDPGIVVLTRITSDVVVHVVWDGAKVTDDPRNLPIQPSLADLEAVVTDSDLAPLVSQGVIEAGKDVAGWSGGEQDPDTYVTVMQTDRGLAVGLASFYGNDWAYLGPSPLKKMLGPETIGGRVRLGAGIEPIGPAVVDALVSPTTPDWVAAGSCPEGFRCRRFQKTVFAFRPAAGSDPGEAWLICHRSDDSTVAVHTRGQRLPANGKEALGPAGAWAFASMVAGTDPEFVLSTRITVAELARIDAERGEG